MSMSIKVDQEVYVRLDNLKGKGDTFSDVVKGLLEIQGAAGELEEMLSNSAVFRVWKREQLEKKTAIFG